VVVKRSFVERRGDLPRKKLGPILLTPDICKKKRNSL